MIRVVTLDDFNPKALSKFCQMLYTAFGVGCEHSGLFPVPAGLSAPLDAEELMKRVEKPRAYPDDRLLYLTSNKLKERSLPTGIAPTSGYSGYGDNRAVVTTYPKKALEEVPKATVRQAMHHVGHLWELHHCLDPRCSMYPPWTPSFPNGEAIFCNYCREKSESKVRLAKS